MITIIQRPKEFTPAFNPVIWQVESDDTTIIFFRVEVYESTTSTLINNLDLFVTPDNPTKSYIDLSTILSNYVKGELDNDLSVNSKAVTKPLLAYRVVITEKLFNSTTSQIEDGDTYEDEEDINFVWYASMDSLRFNSFTASYDILNTFLTNKPNLSITNDLSAESLYFLQKDEDVLKLQVKTYDATQTLLNTYTSTITLGTNNMFRLHISPKALVLNLSVSFTNVAYYTVQLIDESDIPKSSLITYLYRDIDCNLESINLIWVNSLGGIDSYQFINPQESINVTKSLIQKSIYRIDEDENYSDVSADIYNPSDTIINSRSQSSYKINSKELSNAEAYWFAELFQSKQVFAELSNGKLIPVKVTNNNYQVQKNRYIKGQLNTIEIEFTAPFNLRPGY